MNAADITAKLSPLIGHVQTGIDTVEELLDRPLNGQVIDDLNAAHGSLVAANHLLAIAVSRAIRIEGEATKS